MYDESLVFFNVFIICIYNKLQPQDLIEHEYHRLRKTSVVIDNIIMLLSYILVTIVTFTDYRHATVMPLKTAFLNS